MSLEQVLLIAVLMLAPLLNFLVRRLRRRLHGPAPQDVEPAKPALAARIVSPAPVRIRGEPQGLRLTPPSLSSGRRRPRLGVLTRRDVRRGVVLMTVLGPCRGLESPYKEEKLSFPVSIGSQ